MNKFKAGDMIRCIEKDLESITFDKVYQVIKTNEDKVIIKNDEGETSASGYYDHRFSLVVPEHNSKFCQGMRVWSNSYGWGTVKNVNIGTPYPVIVSFDNDSLSSYFSYDYSGKESIYHVFPTLFLDEVKSENWPNPPCPNLDPCVLTFNQPIMVKYNDKSNWVLRYFIGGTKDYIIFANNGHSADNAPSFTMAYFWRLPTDKELETNENN